MSHASDEDIRQRNEEEERNGMRDEHGHLRCPMCGGTARLEGQVDEHGLLYLHPSCIVCGLEGATSCPTLCTLVEWRRMEADRANDAVELAWAAWDSAWWAR
jgi:hypothetical protein